jgi:hypothetical protein
MATKGFELTDILDFFGLDDAADAIELIGETLGIIDGVSSSSDLRDAAALAVEIGSKNADNLIATTEKNRALSKYAAGYTAANILYTGDANARSVEDASRRNYKLMGVQTAYTNWQMELAERQLAGEIRAQAAATGVSVNEGTPLHTLNQEVAEARFDRSITVGTQKLSAMGYLLDKQQEADLIRLDAKQRADMTVFNEAINSQIAWNEALAQAASMRMGAEMNSKSLRIQANSALYNGLGEAMRWAAS